MWFAAILQKVIQKPDVFVVLPGIGGPWDLVHGKPYLDLGRPASRYSVSTIFFLSYVHLLRIVTQFRMVKSLTSGLHELIPIYKVQFREWLAKGLVTADVLV